MKYKIKKQYTVEVRITEVVELLKKAGVLPADMKPEHNIHAGAAIVTHVVGPAKSRCITISWEETEEIGKDGLKKKDVAVDTAAKLRVEHKKENKPNTNPQKIFSDRHFQLIKALLYSDSATDTELREALSLENNRQLGGLFPSLARRLKSQLDITLGDAILKDIRRSSTGKRSYCYRLSARFRKLAEQELCL